jgi:Spy/CpxP family protein refolding chaperone
MLNNLTSNNTLKLVISTLVTYVTFSCTASMNTDSSFPLSEMMKIEKLYKSQNLKMLLTTL